MAGQVNTKMSGHQPLPAWKTVGDWTTFSDTLAGITYQHRLGMPATDVANGVYVFSGIQPTYEVFMRLAIDTPNVTPAGLVATTKIWGAHEKANQRTRDTDNELKNEVLFDHLGTVTFTGGSEAVLAGSATYLGGSDNRVWCDSLSIGPNALAALDDYGAGTLAILRPYQALVVVVSMVNAADGTTTPSVAEGARPIFREVNRLT